MMAVIVEVPDEGMAALVRRLIGRRAGVVVAVTGARHAPDSAPLAGVEQPRRIIVMASREGSGEASPMELVREGVWAVVPAGAPAVNRLLQEYVDEVRTGLSPLLSEICNDRSEVSDLIEALRRTGSGEAGVSETGGENPLSSRETQILQQIARGATSREIADEMGFQLQTVKNKVTTILTKTHARSRTHAVSIALTRGWISR